MSVLVNKDTKVIVQGITGSQGLFHKANDRIRYENCRWCNAR